MPVDFVPEAQRATFEGYKRAFPRAYKVTRVVLVLALVAWRMLPWLVHSK